MSRWKRTYREVDGERIEGTWRPIFIYNGGTYHLTDLFIYADGMIDCWGPVDLDGLRRKIQSGWVATSLPEGGKASAHMLASWRFAEPETWVDADALIGEVADEIERLAGRATSSDRCLAVVAALRERSDEIHRQRLRDAYHAIPERQRMFLLGDMDRNDQPVRVLMTPIGTTVDGHKITAEHHQWALQYFDERDKDLLLGARRRAEQLREAGQDPTTTVQQVGYSRDLPAPPRIEALRTEYRRIVSYAGRSYPRSSTRSGRCRSTTRIRGVRAEILAVSAFAWAQTVRSGNRPSDGGDHRGPAGEFCQLHIPTRLGAVHQQAVSDEHADMPRCGRGSLRARDEYQVSWL